MGRRRKGELSLEDGWQDIELNYDDHVHWGGIRTPHLPQGRVLSRINERGRETCAGLQRYELRCYRQAPIGGTEACLWR